MEADIRVRALGEETRIMVALARGEGTSRHDDILFGFFDDQFLLPSSC